MEENEFNKKEEETTADSKPAKDNKKEDKKGNKKSFSSLLAEYKGEFRKIVWPSKDDLVKQTTTVIVMSLIVGAIIFGVDQVFNFGFKALLKLTA